MALDLRSVAGVITIIRSTEVDKSWDRFVESHPRGTVGHLSAWGTIAREAYGHECIYLIADDGGEIAGVLPLVRISSRLFGRRLVSMPFLDYGGVLADPDRGIETALVDDALRLTRQRGAHGLGLRQFHPEPGFFSWWDYRAGHFHKKMGLRIDAILASPPLASRLAECGIDRNFRKGPKPSDHAPLLAEFQ